MTIKDIAQKCGVSVSTVSRVLNKHAYVNEDVRKRVLSVIEEEHFVPHGGAVGLVRPQQATVGIVVRGAGNQFFHGMLPLFDEAASSAGYTLLTHQIRETDDELRTAAAFVKEKNLKGVILLGGSYDWTEKEAAIIHAPFVCCTFRNLLMSNDTCFPSVAIDDEAEAYRAVNELIARGHRKIAVLVPKVNDKSVSGLRYEGYRKALQDNDIIPDPALVVEVNSFNAQDAYHGMKTLINSGTEFSAVFVFSDYLAIAAMKAVSDAGRRIPEDCSFIAVDGLEISQYTIPTLATMVQPSREIVQKTVAILSELIAGHTVNTHPEVRATLREGGSLACRN